MKFCMLASIFSTASLLYFGMRFLGVPVDSIIIMIVAPASIQTDCFSLSYNLSLNRLMNFDSPSNSSGILIIALLNILIPVVDV